MFRWCFEHRETGRITIAQVPNWPLWLYLAALLVKWVAHPTGRLGVIVTLIKYGSLTTWALDEVARGCNPWRRALGTVVLLALLYSLFLSR